MIRCRFRDEDNPLSVQIRSGAGCIVIIVIDWMSPPLVEPPKTGRTRDEFATLPFPVP